MSSPLHAALLDLLSASERPLLYEQLLARLRDGGVETSALLSTIDQLAALGLVEKRYLGVREFDGLEVPVELTVTLSPAARG